jgi:hypothetical protein
MSDQKIDELCLAKINNHDGYYSKIPPVQKGRMAKNHAIEYRLNLKQVKEIY